MTKFKNSKFGKILKRVTKNPILRTVIPGGNILAEVTEAVAPDKGEQVWSNPVFKDVYQLLILVGIIYFLLTGDIESAEFLKDRE